ncbi:hypothetical protein ANN_12628 [Periplaneta americana]|uniref:Uncharacterized protein n=1 Tax=Periplaneta americana TaxID=6978 RepID=A0ABQ8TJ03_PERAM|nr:hypothetical protein ANN_12628 [Periplaneta americana]
MCGIQSTLQKSVVHVYNELKKEDNEEGIMLKETAITTRIGQLLETQEPKRDFTVMYHTFFNDRRGVAEIISEQHKEHPFTRIQKTRPLQKIWNKRIQCHRVPSGRGYPPEDNLKLPTFKVSATANSKFKDQNPIPNSKCFQKRAKTAQSQRGQQKRPGGNRDATQLYGRTVKDKGIPVTCHEGTWGGGMEVEPHAFHDLGTRMRWCGRHHALTAFYSRERPGRPKRRWEDNIKMDLREVGYDRDWINLAQDRDMWRAYVRAAMNLRIP